MVEVRGSLAPGVLALREQYEHWDVPRNVKKSVQRSDKAEVQGATVDGNLGVAYPRERVGQVFLPCLPVVPATEGDAETMASGLWRTCVFFYVQETNVGVPQCGLAAHREL